MAVAVVSGSRTAAGKPQPCEGCQLCVSSICIVITSQPLHSKLKMDSGGLKQIPSLLWSLGQGTGGFSLWQGDPGGLCCCRHCCRHCNSCCRHCNSCCSIYSSCCRHCNSCCRHCSPPPAAGIASPAADTATLLQALQTLCCRHCNPCCRHCSPSPELAIPEHLANHPLNPAAARLLRRIAHTFNQSLLLPSLGVSVRL